MKKIAYVVGARPQFIKHASLSRKLTQNFKELLIHTGQHYDDNMSKVFFNELKIPMPDYNLGVGSYSHGKQTGRMLEAIEGVLLIHKPDLVIVYGDTNSTLAGALAATKLHIPVAHVEAGLRSFNRLMPEETNRILTDHLSNFLFTPSKNAVRNLGNEGIKENVYNTGDVMYDAILYNLLLAEKHSSVLTSLELAPQAYYLTTIHRAENTDNTQNLKLILQAYSNIKREIIFPIHPRTLSIINDNEITLSENIHVVDPVSYLDMLILMKNAIKILTDSGGVQKEAYFLRKPCITLRDETEWIETVQAGYNVLVGVNPEKIMYYVNNPFEVVGAKKDSVYGVGNACDNIADILLEVL